MPELRSRLVAWFRIGMCCAASPSLREAASLDLYVCGPVAQWIRRRPTEPETAGSSPAGVIMSYGPRRGGSRSDPTS